MNPKLSKRIINPILCAVIISIPTYILYLIISTIGEFMFPTPINISSTFNSLHYTLDINVPKNYETIKDSVGEVDYLLGDHQRFTVLKFDNKEFQHLINSVDAVNPSNFGTWVKQDSIYYYNGGAINNDGYIETIINFNERTLDYTFTRS